MKSLDSHQSDEAEYRRLVSVILGYAIKVAASEIDVLPLNNAVVVSFKVGNTWLQHLKLPKYARLPLAAAIKKRAGIVDSGSIEPVIPKEGQIDLKFIDEETGFRLLFSLVVRSTPTGFGEQLNLRFMEKDIEMFD
jgi:type II secretory ATPase GspE/PulE/Tfp pilus assembly ATPase PilB-like protein